MEMYDEETTKELERIQNEINALQDKLKILRQRTSLAILCEDSPINSIRYSEKADALYFSKARREAWECLRNSTNFLFLDKKNFQSRKGYGFHVTPSIAGRKKIQDMTAEQQQLAAEYLKEVVAVFNRYFTTANDEVIWDGEPYKVIATD